MRLVAALGGNALLRRGEPLATEVQRRNVRVAAGALAPLAATHRLVITHGNGPQVGLLALQAAWLETQPYPLDILDAETEGQIGYLIEQELMNLLPANNRCAALLTRIEVDPDDPAFAEPTKPIGPVCSEADARRLQADRGWTFRAENVGYRRVVASPEPKRILEIDVIGLLVENGVVVICAGGGGIPVARRDSGGTSGVEAVIDKDKASALLATGLKAGALLLLTDVDGVYLDWDTPKARKIKRISPRDIRRHRFAEGSMGPKVESACRFVEQAGGIAGIGALRDAAAILAGQAGTLVTADAADPVFWD